MPIPGGSEALAAIHETFAETVTYTGAGLSEAPLAAVNTDQPAEEFYGSGDGLRSKSFEIRFAALVDAGASSDPAKADLIVEVDGSSWRVIEPVRREDVEAWLLAVEEDS